MEACGSAQHWARKLQGMGHTVKLMAPQFVKPYVKTNKNDAANAEAICEAVARLNMRFVPVKNVDQQAVLALHRVRQSFVKARPAQVNQIRGLLVEFGPIIPQGIGYIATRVPDLSEDCPERFACSCNVCWAITKNWIARSMNSRPRSRHGIAPAILSCKLAQVPGIGPITRQRAGRIDRRREEP